MKFLDEIDKDSYTMEELEELWKKEAEEMERKAFEDIYYEDYANYEDFKYSLPLPSYYEGERL
jgi:hypothetical protein